ncbi:LuxR C-terminal-related transcriptional regulator [Ktedonosporobacter rubrisoli]|uniref:LuxR C-terminal-related transcriptional regulator n=1 Tax=Ktedonosporobacter rubrisoli TaxID=2509675 RepID=UPI0013EEA380|nr:LuxR C-terminal-related transcriptional regulator [Ktedonosporobacter rubrisoli]
MPGKRAAHGELEVGKTSLALPRQRGEPLPVPLTPLIGRWQEPEALAALLQRSEVRLLTVTGQAGVGKTRLALQAAARLAADFPDGLALLPLAGIQDPTLLLPTIAAHFRLGNRNTQPLLEQLQTYFQDKQLLLVLDNFEQLLPAAPLLAEVLFFSPQVKVLVTSRVALRLRGEQLLVVPPLAVPDLAQDPTREELLQNPSVQLLLGYVQRVDSSYQLTDEQLLALAQISTRVAGIPLALELAAGWLQTLSPQALIMRLQQHCLALLTRGSTDLPKHQQSMRQTIAWSYQLLSSQGQHLFHYLAVFAGSCSFEALEDVALAMGCSEQQVLDGLASLIEAHIVERQELQNGQSYLVLPDLLREYGLEVLTSTGRLLQVQLAHARYYLHLVDRIMPFGLQSSSQPDRLAEISQAYDNVRMALFWLLEQPEKSEQILHTSEMALRLCTSLSGFWYMSGHLSEGRQFLARALERAATVSISTHIIALTTAAFLALFQDDYEQCVLLCQEGLLLAQKENRPALSASVLYCWSWAEANRGHLPEATRLGEQALQLNASVENQIGRALCLYSLGFLSSLQAEYPQAVFQLEESLALFRKLEDVSSQANVLLCLAESLFAAQEDLPRIQELLEESQALPVTLANTIYPTNYLVLLGELALSQGDVLRARQQFTECLAAMTRMGDKRKIAVLSVRQAEAELCEHNYTEVEALCSASLSYYLKSKGYAWAALPLEVLARSHAVRQQGRKAASLWGQAQALREQFHFPLSARERAIFAAAEAEARASVGSDTFLEAWREGYHSGCAMLEDLAPTTNLAFQSGCTPPQPILPDHLTRREVEVLRHLAQGLTRAQIAHKLIISPLTVQSHIRSIYRKVGVSTRSAITRYALEQNLL